MARAILRKSGFRAGATSRGIPPGGLKGYAVVKKSDADYDVWWAPNGPYTYNWLELDYPHFPEGPVTVSDDGPAFLSVEPVPVSVNSFAHINQPLRSGVDNQDDYGFKWNPWKFSAGTGAWSDVGGGTINRGPSTLFTNTGFREGAMRGDKSMYPIQAGTQYRLQAYITRCSPDFVIYVRNSLDSVNNPELGDEYHISAPGYFDSGWVDLDMTPGELGNNDNYGSRLVEVFDDGMPDPAIPFFDIQVRTFEVPNFFDWMYAR